MNKTTIKLLREAQRVAAEKKSRENKRRRQNRDFQQLWYLKEKYGSLAAGYAAIDYMRRPSKRNLDQLRARVAAIKKVQQESPLPSEPFDLAKAVAESWKMREPLPPDPPDDKA